MQVEQSMPMSFDNNVSSVKMIPEGEDLTGDSGVLKTILRSGTGVDTPCAGTKVSIHYTGKLLDGTVFDSSLDRGEQFVFDLGANSVIRGWEVVVPTMLLNEKCGVYMSHEYAYGEAGSPPKIPPNATLYFEMELLAFDNERDVSKVKDGGVMKRIIISAPSTNFESPSLDTKCCVRMRVSVGGNVVYESAEQVLYVGQEMFCEGVDIALESMKVSERSVFTILPAYGCNAAGAERFGIPQGVVSQWEIELVSMDKPTPSWKMEPEQKLAAAVDLKDKGNTWFFQSNYRVAARYYEGALKYVEFMVDGDAENARARELFSIINFNLGQCTLKMKKYTESVTWLTKGLEYDSENVKALYRMAMAFDALENYDRARSCLQKILAKDQHNQEVLSALACVNAKISAQERNDRKLYASVFSRL